MPELEDGAEMWRIARASPSLDLNSSYAYMLYCRDYARTCRIATVGDQVAGYILGNIPPERPSSVFVWQIAVDGDFQGRGLAGRMLDQLVSDLIDLDGIDTLETTITDDNTASQRTFRSLAERWGDAPVATSRLFEEEHFPDEHDAEPLYEIGPLLRADSPSRARVAALGR